MKPMLLFSLLTLVLSMVTSGCRTVVKEVNEGDRTTEVQLTRKNFKVLATQVRGESYGFTFLPFVPTSLSAIKDLLLMGGTENILSTGCGFSLYDGSEDEAYRNLYANCEAQQSGKAAVFINIRRTLTERNYVLFSRPKITVTADLIEFTR